MKKRSHSRVLRGLKNAFNFRRWADFERVKGITLYLSQSVQKLFIPRRQESPLPFDKALREFHITNESLLKKQKSLLRLTYFMSFLGFVFFIYTTYLVFTGAWKAVMICTVLMLFTLTLAFRYHFWFFQIKQRKLGCTFQEWFKQGLLGSKD